MKRIAAFLLLPMLLIAAVLAQPRSEGSVNQAKSGTVQGSRDSRGEDDRFESVRAFIRKQMVERQVPSIAVAVARQGQIIWEEGFGWANREDRILATPHTLYSLGSISKPITATGLMILKERGKIDLDRPINDYLGESRIKVWVGNPADATVRVFLPLGLTRMSVDIEPGLEKYQAIRYGTDGRPIPFYTFDHVGGSAVYASAHDLARFGMFHLKARLPDQKAILKDETLDEMQRPTADMGDGLGYGIGWITETRGQRRLVQHSGGMGGVATMLILFPEEKIVIAALANSSSGLPRQVAEEIIAALIPDAARKPPAPNPGALNSTGPFTPPNQLRGSWKGTIHTYKGDVALTLEFKESGDVHVQLGGQLKTLVNNVSLKDDYLTGRMMGDIGTEDANRMPYTLVISLKLRGDALNGAITALSLPAKRAGNALSHWVELKKQ